MQPSEIEFLPFYEYEYMVDDLTEILKEKQEAENGKSANGGQDMNPTSLMNQAKGSMPKLNIPKFPSMPKI